MIVEEVAFKFWETQGLEKNFKGERGTNERVGLLLRLIRAVMHDYA